MPNKNKLGSKPKRNPSGKQKPKRGGKAKVSAKRRLSTPKRSSKTSKVKAKLAVKKLTAPKTKAAPEPTISTAGQESPKFARMAVADVAPQKACLPLPAAIALVRQCFNAPGKLPLDTQLGVLVPDPAARNSCCQCVANGVPIGRSEIPCGSSNTLQDVVDAIAC